MKKLMEKIQEYPFTTALLTLFVLGLIAIAVFTPQGWIAVVVVVGCMLLGALITGAISEFE